jgi:hypothetical protein
MKMSRVVFAREVPSPAVASLSRSSWVLSFDAPQFLILRQGDTLSVTARETGREILYPWASVTAAEPLSEPTQLPAPVRPPTAEPLPAPVRPPVATQLPAPAPAHKKKS